MNCPSCDSPLKTNDACTCGWRKTPAKKNGSPYLFGLEVDGEWIDKSCGWNDHGHVCGRYGHMSQTTNGGGPWYCRDHFSKLMGWDGFKKPIKDPDHKLLNQLADGFGINL